MKALFRRGVWLLLLASAGAGGELKLRAQSPPVLPSPAGVATNTIPTPPLPVFHPRTQLFRDVLAMSGSDREQFLANRPAQNRAPLEAKIREYEAMTPEQRETVLHATQLHEYLQYFVQIPPAERAPQLALVPQDYQAEVTGRLQMFDRLPPPLQKEVLATDSTKAYILGAAPTNALHTAVMPPLPPDPLATLSRLTPEQREKLFANFEHFFDLSDEDRQKVLATLPVPERTQVVKTLSELEKLPSGQRERGLQSISKLANMTEEQRQVFYANADRWEKMTPAERETWRKMATHLPPPLPPLPALPLIPRQGMAVVTNPTR